MTEIGTESVFLFVCSILTVDLQHHCGLLHMALCIAGLASVNASIFNFGIIERESGANAFIVQGHPLRWDHPLPLRVIPVQIHRLSDHYKQGQIHNYVIIMTDKNSPSDINRQSQIASPKCMLLVETATFSQTSVLHILNQWL